MKVRILCLFILVPGLLNAQSTLINHWETVVYDSSIWKYFPGTADPGSTWTTFNYNDSVWPSGKGSIGYGDNDDRTIISPVMSVFLRRKFVITDSTKIASVVLNVDYDDGFVAYLNGTEIARANIGTGTPLYNQATPTDHEALLYQGLIPDHYIIDNELLQQGENIITVEVHNVTITSSDLTSAVFLSLGIIDDSKNYYPTPTWFTPPIALSVTTSNLPVITISTTGQLINSNATIIANMGITDNGPGLRNGFHDVFNNYSGLISIEVHGESSQQFPKKSYRIETEDAAGNNLNVSLLGMPAENDWILYAPYSDKSMLRNMLAYELGRKLGRYYAPRAKFVELILNDEYQGVYMLVEKIKVDKNRVNISKLKTTDIAGDDVTGGYLLRVDKIDAGNYPAWTPVPNPALPNEANVTFQYYDPKGEDLVTQQRTYIQNFIQQFESALSSPNYTDTAKGYHHYINEASFIDLMLIEEISKNVDAYAYSTYMYKTKDSKGGKLTMGPLWDFDLAFGNVNYNSNSQNAPGWTYSEQYRMFWFRRLMTSSTYADSMKCRWTSVRQNILSDASISSLIDSAALVLGESEERNFKQWPILGTYVWPNQFVGTTYADEVNYLKTWISTRLSWMDINMPGKCQSIITGLEAKNIPVIYLYPNPTKESFKIQFQKSPDRHVSLAVYSVMGTQISSQEVVVQEDLIWDSALHNIHLPSPGFYYVMLRTGDEVIFKSKLIKL